MTCDNDRPCNRCIARGLAETCRDGSRKKAKYLADVPEAVAQSSEAELFDPRYKGKRDRESSVENSQIQQTHTQNAQANSHSNHTDNNNNPHRNSQSEFHRLTPNVPISAPTMSPAALRPPVQNDLGQAKYGFDFPLSFQPLHTSSSTSERHKSFQSSAVDLEYNILSNILNGSSTNMTTSQDNHAISPSFSEDSSVTSNSILSNSQMLTPNYLNQFPLGDDPLNTNLSDILASVDLQTPSANDWLHDKPKPRPISFTIVDPAQRGRPTGYEDPFTRSTFEFAQQQQQLQQQQQQQSYQLFPKPKRPSDIYRNVKQPFPYTPGFHMLIKYLKSRFNKSQLMQMAKCMARYRPSFIACTGSLMEDDLIFMEQSFQRTLMEYEKYISFSGTPTVVWRRTGQIAAVGQEFCILTGWSKSQLLDQNRFIIELMDDDSVLEYFEMFSNIAFGDSRGATMSECTLLTPNAQRLKTSSIWTLKRDVFGIPMMIIGNFLPILPQ